MAVQWVVVVPEGQALTAREAVTLGYQLPVRSVFARLHNGPAARKLETALKGRQER